MNENEPYAKERDATAYFPGAQRKGMAASCRDPSIENLRRVLDIRHPESEEFEAAFRLAVWEVMAARFEQLERTHELPITIPTNKIEDVIDSYYAGTGISYIIAECRRVMVVEGYDSAHDDKHSVGEMAAAASAYACPKAERKMDPLRENKIPWVWPWEDAEWKPGPTRIRELSKAGALIVAEIERILRKERKTA